MPYFLPLSDEFFEQLHSLITERVDCKNCESPQCSCSGAHTARVIFLPGERMWIERQTDGVRFRGDYENSFPVCGDCNFLDEDKVCTLPFIKPWDCLSFPMQPHYGEAGYFVYDDAPNCPGQYSAQWLRERTQGWLMILQAVDPLWLRYYSDEPIYQREGKNAC